MAFVARFLIPYKKVNFLQSYFQSIRLIEAHRRGELLSDEDAKWHRTLTGRIGMAHLAVTITCFKLLLHCYYPLHDLKAQIVCLDVLNMMNLNRVTQLMSVGFILLMHVVYGGSLFVHYPPYFLSHYYPALVLNKLDSLFLPPYLYQGRDILQQSKKHVFIALNLITASAIALYVFMSYLQFCILFTINNNWNQSEATHLELAFDVTGPVWHALHCLLTLIFSQICFAIFSFFLLYIVFIGTLLSGVVHLMFSLNFALFGQIMERFARLRAHTFIVPLYLVAMLRHRRRCMVFFLKLAPFFSNLFMTWMLYNIPFSAYLAYLIFFDLIKPEWLLFAGAFVIQQWVVIFGIHLMGVGMNQFVKRPNLPLWYLAVSCTRKRLSLRPTLMLGLHLEAFHTRKKYGFSYSSVGVATMLTFVKTILLYCQVLMYVFITAHKQ